MLYITSDHGGFKLKETLVAYLKTTGQEITDLGPTQLVVDDDYPLYVKQLAPKVLENPDNLGIVICRNGVGVSICANKFKGIRCALSWTPEHAKSTKNDDNANVLALPADYIDEATAKQIITTWLETPFNPDTRFIRRIAEIE